MAKNSITMDTVTLNKEPTIEEMLEDFWWDRKKLANFLSEEIKAECKKINDLLEYADRPIEQEDIIRLCRLPSSDVFKNTLMLEGSTFRKYMRENESAFLGQIEWVIDLLVYSLYNYDWSKKLLLKNFNKEFGSQVVLGAIIADLPEFKHVLEYTQSKSFNKISRSQDSKPKPIIEILADSILMLSKKEIMDGCWWEFKRLMNLHTNNQMREYRDGVELIVSSTRRPAKIKWTVCFNAVDITSHNRAKIWFEKYAIPIFRRFIAWYFSMNAWGYVNFEYGSYYQRWNSELPIPHFDSHSPVLQSTEFILHKNNRNGSQMLDERIDNILINPSKKNHVRLHGPSSFDKEELVNNTILKLQKSAPRLSVNRTMVPELKWELKASMRSIWGKNLTHQEETSKRDDLNQFTENLSSSNILIIEWFDSIVDQLWLIKRILDSSYWSHIIFVSNSNPADIKGALDIKKKSLPEVLSYVKQEWKNKPTIFKEDYEKFINILDLSDNSSIDVAPADKRRKILERIIMEELWIFNFDPIVQAVIIECVESVESYRVISKILWRKQPMWLSDGGEIDVQKIIEIIEENITLKNEIALTAVKGRFDDFLIDLEEENFYPSLIEQTNMFIYLAYYMTKPNSHHFLQSRSMEDIGKVVYKKRRFVGKTVKEEWLKNHRFAPYRERWLKYCKEKIISGIELRALNAYDNWDEE